MKKFLSLVLALVMTMSLVTVSAGAKDFGDSADLSGEAYEEAVNVMSEMGIIDGYSDGDFRPQGTLTRQAAAKIIACMMLGKTTAESLGTSAAPFKDVPAGSSFAGYIAFCVERGLISGYADGTFRPTGTLTGFAFLKMLLGALGYDQSIEGYTGTNWTVNVAGRAYEIGLTDGNDNFVGSKAATREEAALYAVNTLQATLVEYENKGSSITINGIEVVQGASAPTYVTSSIYNQATSINDDKDNASGDYTVEFAERYQTDLRLEGETDVFGRPARVWSWKGEEIGTYVDYSLMVAEYTTSVTGKELYDAIGKTAYDKYDFYSYVDGDDSDLYKDIARNNKGDIDETGNGALTQAFVDVDDESVVVTVVNTYLAQANADYNEKKDTVSLKVYLDADGDNKTVSGEDFNIADVVEDEFFLVTYADNAVQSIDDVEIISETNIDRFSAGKGGSVTVDGTKYSYNMAAAYDADVLEDYTTEGGSVTNLKDTTYNIYLDQYGYVIGIDIVDKVNNYVFITGVDSNSSNLSNKTWDANALFLDGTSDVIEVKNNGEVQAAPVVNSWYTYTVSNSDVYTLTKVNDSNAVLSDDDDEYDIGQKWSNASEANKKIDAKHISLQGIDTDTRVYGNEDTIYLLGALEKVTKGGVDYTVINDVDEVVTGVENAAFELYTRSDARDEAEATLGTASNENTSSGAYGLYGDDGYLIAVVVVGESSSISKDVAYVISDDIDEESYDRTTELWTWTREVIIDGQSVMLTEQNDTGVSVLDDSKITEKWVTVNYDANGFVKSVDLFTTSDDEYANSIAGAVSKVEADEELVVVQIANELKHEYTLKGSTLYDETSGKLGFLVASDVNVVLKQEVDSKTETTYDTGVDTLKSILEDLNEDGANYEFNAIIEDGRATTVIILDETPDKDHDSPDGKPVKKGSLELTGVTYDDTGKAYDIAMKVTKEIKGAATWSAEITTANGAKVASATKVAFITNDWAVGTTPVASVSGAKKAAEELKIVVTFYDANGDVLATGEDFLAI